MYMNMYGTYYFIKENVHEKHMIMYEDFLSKQNI